MAVLFAADLSSGDDDTANCIFPCAGRKHLNQHAEGAELMLELDASRVLLYGRLLTWLE